MNSIGNRIERFCNDVASEFMLPNSEFKSFSISNFQFDDLKATISDYAFSKKLSNTHVAYRLHKRGDIDEVLWNKLRDFYHNKWVENQKKVKDKNKQKDGGPDYYILKNYKLGKLVDFVQRLTYAGALTTTKAGMLLDTKPLKVHRLFQSEQFT